MRPVLLIVLGATLVGCPPPVPPNPPPAGQFYFPTGIAHAAGPGPDGVLYVASSNFDKRYDFGSITALDLAKVVQPNGSLGLPAFGEFPDGGTSVEIVRLTDDGGTPQQVFTGNLAGEMAVYPTDAGVRLFLPTRGDGDYLHIVDTQGLVMSCKGLLGDRNCIPGALSLTRVPDGGSSDPAAKQGEPRAQQPYGVTVSPDGFVYVTHLYPADDPPGSTLNPAAFLVKLSAANPVLDAYDFTSLNVQGNYGGITNSVVSSGRWVYVTGRPFQNNTPAQLVRAVDQVTGAVIDLNIEANAQALDARGIVLSRDHSRLYVASRGPDALLVVAIENPETDSPRFHVVRAVPMPSGVNELQLIDRAGLLGTAAADLVVASCTSANTVVVYDDGVGEVVAEVPGIGSEPFGLAVDAPRVSLSYPGAVGARVYVSDFGDGRVGVIDIPDLTHPEQTLLVAHLGMNQTCILAPQALACLPTSTP